VIAEEVGALVPEVSLGTKTAKMLKASTTAATYYDPSVDHDRVIPSAVKIEVWKRDKGRCVKCGSKENLHLDHIIPYSQGGPSKDAENIQILCSRHNLEKHDRIE